MSVKYNPERLLNTAEAARFLRVSQASIRRWNDAGMLPGRRVGRRRERRFSEPDLLAFMEQQAPTKPADKTVNVGGVPITVPGHLATLFATDAGGLRLTVPFLAEGLAARHTCLLVAADDVLERYLIALRGEEDIDLDRALEIGLFTIVRFQGGEVHNALSQWERHFSKALAKGPTIIRIVGEMVSERKMFASEEEMLRYEEALELMHRRYPVVVICQYDVRKFDGVALLRALKAHPGLFDHRLGTFLS